MGEKAGDVLVSPQVTYMMGGERQGCQVPKIRCAAEHISFLQGPFLGVLQGCMAIPMVVMTIIIPDMHVNSHTFMSSYIF